MKKNWSSFAIEIQATEDKQFATLNYSKYRKCLLKLFFCTRMNSWWSCELWCMQLVACNVQSACCIPPSLPCRALIAFLCAQAQQRWHRSTLLIYCITVFYWYTVLLYYCILHIYCIALFYRYTVLLYSIDPLYYCILFI